MLVNLLDHYSIIEISGEDHLNFLQGQLTNDVKKNEKKFIYSGMCNPKGRLFAFLRILRVPDLNSTFLVIPSSLADAVQKRLTMFILRSKVVIQKAENFHLLGIIDDSPLINIPVDQKLILPDQTNRSVIILNDLNLFNQITSGTLAQIQEDILSVFRKWLPFVEVRNIELKSNDSFNMISINIVFNIKQDPDTLDSVQIAVTEDVSEQTGEVSTAGGGGY